MSNSLGGAQPILLCPLQFERSALVAAGLEDCCNIVCCGPGNAAGIWVKEHCKDNTSIPIILAGLAGALSTNIHASTAHIAWKIIDVHGGCWAPTLNLDETTSKVTIVSTGNAVTTPQAKRALADRTNADIVDLESAGFAAAADANGLHWAIVRGISDSASDSLPSDIEKWVDSKGKTKPSAVVGSILRKPAVLGDIRKMRSASIAAMKAVSEIIKSVIIE